MKGSRWDPSCEYQWVNNTKNVWPPSCLPTVNQVIKSFGWQWSQFLPTKNLDPGHKHFNRWHISDYQHLDWFLLAYTSWQKHTQKYIRYVLILRLVVYYQYMVLEFCGDLITHKVYITRYNNCFWWYTAATCKWVSIDHNTRRGISWSTAAVIGFPRKYKTIVVKFLFPPVQYL